jgi:seryl-tRNA synthetase
MAALTIACDAASADLKQCLYAAAFLVPGVTGGRYEAPNWHFELDRATDEAVLKERLARLVARFPKSPAGAREVFRLDPPEGQVLRGLPAELPFVHPIALGLNVYAPEFARLVRFLDAALVRRYAAEFHPREESYPNVIPLASLWQANHLNGFPEHLHLLTHLETDVVALDAFVAHARKARVAEVAPGDFGLAAARLAANPSTCYHCYALRANTDIGDDLAVTAVTKCHRFEAINHREAGRLLEFTMREVIFLGSPDFVRSTRERSLRVVEDTMRQWQICGALVTANDPFFSSDFTNKASQQQRLAMKYEYRALLPPHNPISVLSSNLHGPTFSKAFSITQRGHPINTGCIGFGIERLALAILAQHGADDAGWPQALRVEYADWRGTDPLSA